MANANTWTALQLSTNTGTSTWSGGIESGTKIGAPFLFASSTTQWSDFKLLTATNASTTNLTVGTYFNVAGRVFNGYRFVTFPIATSTEWTASTTISIVAPFTGTFQDVQCSVPTGTLNVQFLVNATNVTKMFNASSTVGQVTFTANNTFSAGDLIKMTAGTPASSPTEANCTARATGA